MIIKVWQTIGELADAIVDFSRESDSWFDLAAMLVVFLMDCIDSEELFISQYFEENDLGHSPNPNRDLLLDTQERVASIVLSERRLFVTYEDASERIASMLTATRLESYADERRNESTLIWAVIKGIDLAYEWDGSSSKFTNRGPLNTKYLDEIGVYLKPLDTPLRACSKGSVFERVVSGRRFNAQLSTINFYRTRPDQKLPIIVGVKKPTPDASSRDLLLEGQDVALVTFERLPVGAFDSRELIPAFESSKCDFNIGIVSFTGVDFVKEGENSPIHLEPSYGTSFVVTYPSLYDDLFLDMIDETIESAVANGCDILLFPELTISPSALNVIRQSLCGLNERSRLKLVVAGSTYELNGDGSAGDNVCHIFDAHGQEIGRHYKRMPVELSFDGNELVEALEHPGWQTTIVDIEGIGRMVVGICKDLATNDDYVTRFVSDFEADLVLLPAMSSSLNRAFTEPTRSLATRHLAISVVCNQCGARSSTASEEETLEYGRVVAPAKGDGANQKQAGFTELALCRKPGCLEKCRTAYAENNPICCFRQVRIVNEPAGHGFRLIEEDVCI